MYYCLDSIACLANLFTYHRCFMSVCSYFPTSETCTRVHSRRHSFQTRLTISHPRRGRVFSKKTSVAPSVNVRTASPFARKEVVDSSHPSGWPTPRPSYKTWLWRRTSVNTYWTPDTSTSKRGKYDQSLKYYHFFRRVKKKKKHNVKSEFVLLHYFVFYYDSSSLTQHFVVIYHDLSWFINI